MAYQISYYADPAMSSRQADTDTISDAALASYPAPQYPETAEAIHSQDRTLNRYGYSGAWHTHPPRECREREHREQQAAAAQRAGAVRELQAQLPHAVAADGETITVRMADGERQTITWRDLHNAARQHDRDLAAVYAQIEREALVLINR